ncbi:MAG: amidohydrolase [Cytophagales bacterium]|nr:amidohydrolase [Cytophagales bacterium]
MLKVATIQTDIYWENISANLAEYEERLWELEEEVDIIIFPEMFTTGFSNNVNQLAEPMNLTTTKWLKQIAQQQKAVVVASLIIKEGGQFYNRLLWVEPSGAVDYYDKRHLFRMGGEHEVYTGGEKRIIKEVKGFNVCPLICYDLRFPVWSRNQNKEYDVLLYIANFPASRREVWNTLLKARALENMAYVIGVNRVGVDGNGISYSGDTQVISAKGEVLYDAQNCEEIHITNLSKEGLEDLREKFPVHLDADKFEIK